MSTHALANARSLALHRAVAERISDDPSLLAKARARVERWREDGSVHPEYVRAWSKILKNPPEKIVSFLTNDDERSRALRQASPFAFVLGPRERWLVWRQAVPA